MIFFNYLSFFRVTIIAVLLGIIKLILSYTINIDLFEALVVFLESVDQYEIDEIILFVLLILGGVLIDNILLAHRRHSIIEIKEQRLRVLKATMSSVQDIVNNFMQSVLLIKMEAQKTHALKDESIKHLNDLIIQTDARLKKISNLQDTPEKKIGVGLVVIDYEKNDAKHKID